MCPRRCRPPLTPRSIHPPLTGSLALAWLSLSQGRWGDASSAKKPNTIFAEFIGQVHMLTLTGGGGYESIRCSDGEVVKGKLATAGQ